jgi:hypothetical protein
MSTIRGSIPALAETGRIVADTVLGWLREFDGFQGLVILTDEEGARARVITFWESEEAAERSREGRLKMRDRLVETVGLEVEGMEPYDVAALELDVAHLGDATA